MDQKNIARSSPNIQAKRQPQSFDLSLTSGVYLWVFVFSQCLTIKLLLYLFSRASVWDANLQKCAYYFCVLIYKYVFMCQKHRFQKVYFIVKIFFKNFVHVYFHIILNMTVHMHII